MPAYQIILALLFAVAFAALSVICYRVGIVGDLSPDDSSPEPGADQ
ncbi:hypothetical protein [Nocardia brasiliensis]|nr:hypothetical protein [Nocardia brasiliensis]